MSDINEKRTYFVTKWMNELSKKLERTKEDLLSQGILATDFGSKNVFIEHEDGSSSFYKYAFYVENKEEYAIFTEHCDYHEFKKDWLEQIQEEESINIDKLVTIKWIGDGNLYVECDKERLYLNKLELKSLQREVGNFINYYGEDFSPQELRLMKNANDKK